MTLREKIEQILELKINDLKDNTKLIELGLDSIKIVELAGIIHEYTKIELGYKDVFKIDKKWIF